MTKDISMEAMGKVVDALRPLAPEDRGRTVRAALALLGESLTEISSLTGPESLTVEHGFENLPARARTWMKQTNINATDLEQVFQKTAEGVEVVAAHLPGRNKKEQMYEAYILTGIGQLLMTGTQSFSDKSARTLCKTSGCYDDANHSAYLRDRGNVFAGSKDRGWILTAPGLTRGAEIIREIVGHT